MKGALGMHNALSDGQKRSVCLSIAGRVRLRLTDSHIQLWAGSESESGIEILGRRTLCGPHSLRLIEQLRAFTGVQTSGGGERSVESRAEMLGAGESAESPALQASSQRAICV